MRVFLTGATGYVGGAIARAADARGFEVLALTRSADRLRIDGVQPIVGDLTSPDVFPQVDVAIHAAYDYSVDAAEATRRDLEAVRSMLANAKHVLYTSSAFRAREEQERLVIESTRGVVIRCGFVYGNGGGMIPELVKVARERGVLTYTAPGTNRWGVVHVDDVASLYLLAIEREARSLLHAAEEEMPTVREVSEAITPNTTRGVSIEESRETWGGFADTMAHDVAVDTAPARALGWVPQHAWRRDMPQA